MSSLSSPIRPLAEMGEFSLTRVKSCEWLNIGTRNLAASLRKFPDSTRIDLKLSVIYKYSESRKQS
jgi:hypothetical protein